MYMHMHTYVHTYIHYTSIAFVHIFIYNTNMNYILYLTYECCIVCTRIVFHVCMIIINIWVILNKKQNCDLNLSNKIEIDYIFNNSNKLLQ